MMRVLLLPVLLAFAAASYADGASARAAFERTMLSCCQKGTYMRHYSHAPQSARYDCEAGPADYLFVLSYRGTTRACFIKGTVRDGRFLAGRRYVFGQVPELVTETQFESLRETEAMFSIRLDGAARPYVCLYPRRSFGGPERYPDISNLRSESPAAEMLGALPVGNAYAVRESRLRFHVFGCRTTYRGADGIEVALGETALGKTIAAADIIAKCRAALEVRYPDRVGTVSDRDVVDWCRSCTVTYEPVDSYYGSW